MLHASTFAGDTLVRCARPQKSALATRRFKPRLRRSRRATDAANRLTSLTLNGASVTLAYDQNGNLTQKIAANSQTTSYTWDARNRLTGINGFDPLGNPVMASFRYDALGRRIEKTVNGSTVQYLYDGPNAIAELRGNAISANILTGLAIDEVIARYTAQGERTLLTDALGSVIVSAKEDGTVQTAYGYSPYGQTQVLGTDEGNPSQYTARENDGTGLYYYRARYYDPQLKRFASEDPIGLAGGINPYGYVGGNPVSNIDPEGLMGRGPGKGPYAPGTGPGTGPLQIWDNLPCEAKCNALVGMVCGPLATAVGFKTLGTGWWATYAACRAEVSLACFAKCDPSPPTPSCQQPMYRK
jgi:RHS repeat-associated protein